LVLSDSSYREYYKSLEVRGHTIILDNSVIELGEPLPASSLLEAREHFPRAVFVLPDRLRDYEGTVGVVREASASGLVCGHLMIVPQGVDWLEWLQCFSRLKEVLSSASGVLSVVVGVPRLTEDWPGGRSCLLSFMLSAEVWKGPFWLLGIQHSLGEVSWAKGLEGVLGFDSSLPVKAAAAGVHPRNVRNLRELPDSEAYSIEDVRENVRFISRWCVDGA